MGKETGGVGILGRPISSQNLPFPQRPKPVDIGKKGESIPMKPLDVLGHRRVYQPRDAKKLVS